MYATKIPGERQGNEEMERERISRYITALVRTITISSGDGEKERKRQDGRKPKEKNEHRKEKNWHIRIEGNVGGLFVCTPSSDVWVSKSIRRHPLMS